jgi:hypothetical protein
MTSGHEFYHAEGFLAGQSDEEVAMGDRPTNATGPASKAGEALFKEKPDISKKDAEKFLQELLKEKE